MAALQLMMRLPTTESFRPGEKILAEKRPTQEILVGEILAAGGVKEI
ncbi:MAG: hypothetical protein K6E78_10265 [Treponema sp.]|nr:hypothetical protein [Treponema sp.]